MTGLLLAWSGARMSIPAWAQGPEVHAVAQEAAEQAAPQIQRTYLNKGVIQLPIHIDERARAQVQEIQLFVKTQPNEPWQKYARATWGQNVFTFNAPRDGEYAFAMVTLDQQGRSTPPDLSKEAPGLVVVIDRQAPQIELTTLASGPDGQMIQCDARDEHLDPQKTRLHYQTGDKLFRAIDPLPGRPNVFCIPTQAVFTGLLRVVAADLAGNVTSREVHINQLLAASGQPAATKAGGPGEPRPLPIALGGQQDAQPETGPTLPVAEKHTAERQANKVAVPQAEGPVIPQESGPLPTQRATAASAESRPPQAREVVAPQRQLINNPHLFLDYAVDQTGSSGIGKVEIWLTRDQGQSWERHCEDADKKSPAEIDLPGEGLFGITLVVTNGRGFGAIAPNPGDAPQWWVEVDTTRPSAEITGVKAIAEAPGSMQISWRVSDKNLAADSIELYHAATRQGPWQLIAKGLRNEAAYRWTPPGEAGSQAYLRLCARDMAGNSALTETTQPVLLDDQSRPRAQILGASTIVPTRAAASSQSN